MKFLDLAQSLQKAIKFLSMYTEAHPRSQEALHALTEAFGVWLTPKPSLHIAASGGKVFVDGVPQESQNVHSSALARQLSERQIAGFIIHRGVTADDLLEMLKILILKPSMLEQMGGVAKVMADRKLRHITLGQVQYKEVRKGDTASEEGGGAPEIQANPDAQVLEQISKMLERWKAGLDSTLKNANPILLGEGGSGGDNADAGLVPALEVLPADLAFLGPIADDLGWGNGIPTQPQVESLRQALFSLPGRSLWSVIAGLSTLPSIPPGLKEAIQGLVPELVEFSTAKLLQDQVPWTMLQHPLLDMLRTSPHQQAILNHLNTHLREGGLDQGMIQDLVHQIDWDQLSLEEKTRRALTGESLWEIGPDQRLALLRSLLDLERFDTFLQILERMLQELTSDRVSRREAVTQDLVAVSQWMRDPGLPFEVQGALIQALTAHFGWESVHAIHRNTAKALEHVFVCLVVHEEFAHVRDLMHEIEGLCAFIDDQHEWRGLAMAKLRARLSAEDMMVHTVDYLHRIEPDKVLTHAIPYFEFLGEPAARHLIRILGDEPDRRRRGRLLDVIRVMGPIAIPALTEGLYSPTWYFVRNTLNLLADMGDAGLLPHVATCLRHPDGRVRASAVRALWKLGGPAASAPLLGELPAADPDTQVEILFGLGQIQAPTAVPGIAELARQGGASLKVRIKAVEALGQIAAPAAVPALLEILRRKGRIFSSAEPTELRVAVARALLSIATPEAESGLRHVIGSEPRSQDREALQRILDLHRAPA